MLIIRRVWEKHVTKFLKLHLTAHSDALFVDVGANIGYFTLFAAALGRNVVAFEPVRENLRRLKKGVQLNGLEHQVFLLQNVAADHRNEVRMVNPNKKCQGCIKVSEGSNAKQMLENNGLMQSTMLDDCFPLFGSMRKPIIIKMDVGK